MNWPLHRSPLKSSTAAREASSKERVVVRGQRQNHQLHSLEVVPFKGGSSPRPSRRSRRPWTRCRRTSWDRSSVSSVCFSNNSSRWCERHPKIVWLFFTLGELAHDLRSCIFDFELREYLLDVIGVWKAVQSDMESREPHKHSALTLRPRGRATFQRCFHTDLQLGWMAEKRG